MPKRDHKAGAKRGAAYGAGAGAGVSAGFTGLVAHGTGHLLNQHSKEKIGTLKALKTGAKDLHKPTVAALGAGSAGIGALTGGGLGGAIGRKKKVGKSMDQISKQGAFSAGRLASLPKHKAFGAKGSAGPFKPGKRAAGPKEGPLTRRLAALQKNDSVSAFGVDHAMEIEKFSMGGGFRALKAGTSSRALKATQGIQAQGAKMQAAGTKRKFQAIPRMAAGKGGTASYKAGTAQQKVGGALANASSGKILGVGGAAAGAGAAGAGGVAFGMNRKKP